MVRDLGAGAPSSFLFLVAMPGAPSSFLFLVVRPGAPSSVSSLSYPTLFQATSDHCGRPVLPVLAVLLVLPVLLPFIFVHLRPDLKAFRAQSVKLITSDNYIIL